MQREFKFRGKVKDHDPMTNPENGWVEGFYIQDLCNGEVKHFIYNAPMRWEVLPATVGQFTGLKDKNGRDIYEGDIMTLGDRTNRIGVIQQSDREPAFVLNVKDTLFDLYYRNQDRQYEVLGNIHDRK